VYRQFKDVGQFMVELKDILGKEKSIAGNSSATKRKRI